MGVNSLPKTVTRQRGGCDLNPGPSAPESSTLTTRLPSQPTPRYTHWKSPGCASGWAWSVDGSWVRRSGSWERAHCRRRLRASPGHDAPTLYTADPCRAAQTVRLDFFMPRFSAVRRRPVNLPTRFDAGRATPLGKTMCFTSDLWPVRPNRQLALYTDVDERKIQGYAHIQYNSQ